MVPSNVTSLLNLQAELAAQSGNFGEATYLSQLRASLLTNGYQPPIPRKMLNQRQRRKRARQKPN